MSDNSENGAGYLKIFAKGFQTNERRLLDGVVMLSQRRNPRLKLLDDADAPQADAVLVDAADRHAMAWAKMQPWLSDRTVIWVDSHHEHDPGHTVVKRPVQWPGLPILLARAMEENSLAHTGHSEFGTSSILENPHPAPTAGGAPQTKCVLVTDDSLAVRNHLQSLLGRVGILVTAVENGEMALMAASQRDFDCVLMDVLMPGMDGYETCRRLKQINRNLPVVMLTSKSSPFDRIRGKMSGSDAYLTKPVNPKDLQTALARFLRARR